MAIALSTKGDRCSVVMRSFNDLDLVDVDIFHIFDRNTPKWILNIVFPDSINQQNIRFELPRSGSGHNQIA